MGEQCSRLLEAIRNQMRLRPDSIHGLGHWQQVASNGLLLARTTGADPDVIRLFALFHDSCRENESRDPEHGPRGAELARAWRGVRYDLDDARLELLIRACREHTRAIGSTGDVTVDTCIDSDRLDLARVGIRPDPARLLTEAARELAQRAIRVGVSLADYRDFLNEEAAND